MSAASHGEVEVLRLLRAARGMEAPPAAARRARARAAGLNLASASSSDFTYTYTSPYTRYEIWTFFYRMVLTGAVALFEAGSVLQFTVGIFMSVIILDVQLRCVLLTCP